MQMTIRRLWPAIALALLVTFFLTGCGGQSAGDTLEGMAAGAIDVVVQYMPQINLPRITVTYDETGVPTIFGLKTSSIAQFLPLNLSVVELPPETVRWLKERNVQHVELDVNDAGLFIYANGMPLPYLAWSRDSLAYAGDLLDRLDVVQSDTTIAKALPLVGRVGIDVLAAFPMQAGAERIPPRDRSQRALAEAPPVAEPTAVIQAVIEYSADGVPRVAGITSREISQLARIDLSPVELTPDNMALIKTAGVQQVAVTTQPDGLHLMVNEQQLPRLAYTEQHLLNAIDLYAQLYGGEQIEVLATFLRNITPLVYGADIDLVVQFSASE